MNTYKLILAYNGTRFSGWQTQKNAISIQSTIEEKLHILLKHPTPLIGAGRTDAGVHAKGQVAHFKTPLELDLFTFFHALNGLLPLDIRLVHIEPALPSFHARYSAVSKEYHYSIDQGKTFCPLTHPYRYHHPYPLDLAAIQEGCLYFQGTHDFCSFANKASQGSAAKNSIRTIYRIELKPNTDGFHLEFEGNGFLYKMVRNITGVLLDIGRKKLLPCSIPHFIQARDRKQISTAAPAKGLCLMHVTYPACTG